MTVTPPTPNPVTVNSAPVKVAPVTVTPPTPTPTPSPIDIDINISSSLESGSGETHPIRKSDRRLGDNIAHDLVNHHLPVVWRKSKFPNGKEGYILVHRNEPDAVATLPKTPTVPTRAVPPKPSGSYKLTTASSSLIGANFGRRNIIPPGRMVPALEPL